MTRGFFAIGVYRPKKEVNIGTLWRSAHLYGAAFIFTVGRRYTQQASDTPKTIRSTPLLHFEDMEDLKDHLPWSCPLVGVELDDRACPLPRLIHPERSAYLLGAEDHGLPQSVMDECHTLTQIPYPGAGSMNVATAGTVVLHDRYTKETATCPR